MIVRRRLVGKERAQVCARVDEVRLVVAAERARLDGDEVSPIQAETDTLELVFAAFIVGMDETRDFDREIFARELLQLAAIVGVCCAAVDVGAFAFGLLIGLPRHHTIIAEGWGGGIEIGVLRIEWILHDEPSGADRSRPVT